MSNERKDMPEDMKPEWGVQDAINLFFSDKKQDGDILSREWIAFALDLRGMTDKCPGLEALERMGLFRDAMLKQHRIALETVWGKGYRVVPPSEQAEYGSRVAVNLIRKGLHKGGAILHHTRTEKLTNAQAARHTDAEVRMAGLKALFERKSANLLDGFVPKGPAA